MKPLTLLALVFLIASTNTSTSLAAPLPAIGNPAATYENGIFRLPVLGNPKDQYTIVVQRQGGEKDSFVLPAGATGLIVGDGVLPDPNWTWSFLLQPFQKSTLSPATPESLHLSASELAQYDGGTLLEWHPVDQATKYRISVGTDQGKPGNQTPDWGEDSTTECSTVECVNMDKNFKKGHFVHSAKPGKQYRWRVSAINKDGIVIATSEYRTIAVDPTLSAKLVDKGWKFQRSDTLSKTIASQPALFGYLSNQGNGTPRTSAYQAEFAVIWTDNKPVFGTLYPRVAYEGKFNSSGASKPNDTSRFRAGTTQSLDYFEWTGSYKYETERKTRTNKGMLELNIVPTVGPLARYFPIPASVVRDSAGNIPINQRPIAFVMPSLSFGMDVGKTFAVGTSTETTNSLQRYRMDSRLDIQWAQFASILGIPRFGSFLESTRWRLPKQSASHTFSKVGFSWGLTSELSFDIAYSVGYDAPDFTFARTTSAGLGIKF